MIQKFWIKTYFHVAFSCKYDAIQSGSSIYDDVMTEQVSGVSGAYLVGWHIPSVPKQCCCSSAELQDVWFFSCAHWIHLPPSQIKTT